MFSSKVVHDVTMFKRPEKSYHTGKYYLQVIPQKACLYEKLRIKKGICKLFEDSTITPLFVGQLAFFNKFVSVS
jgi:hypothetical protein